MRRILAIGGMPGTGKSVMMRAFLEGTEWEIRKDVPLVDSMYDKTRDLHVLGLYNNDETFPGTDKFSMAVQPNAIQFAEGTTSNILFEGDRLFTKSFLEHLFSLPDTEVGIFILEVPDAVREERYKERGSEQNQKFIDGRRTKVENVRKAFDYTGRVATFNHSDEADKELVVRSIREFFAGTYTFPAKSGSSLDDFFS